MARRLVVPPILMVPGHRGAGPTHWQTLLERRLALARRVDVLRDETPSRSRWLGVLDRAIAGCDAPPVLVAHSLGCIAVAHWAATTRRPVRAALLVAPCDVERPELAATLRSFAPLPRAKLDFPSCIAASSDDPDLDVERARDLAHDWGARLVIVGALGGIDSESGLGPWLEGETLLAELLCRACA